jgi:hypothetical protein
MMHYAPTQARFKGSISTPSCGWGKVEAAATKAPSTSPPPITDGVDKLYRQLVEIHTIAAVQLMEGARWCRSYSTYNPIRAGTH